MEFQYQINYSTQTNPQSALPLLFAARMMVIFLIWVRGMDNVLPPFLPFIESIESLRGFPKLFKFLDWIYWISLVMVFTGVRFRAFSLVISCLIFYSILSSKLQFSNSFLYSGCIFFLIGIYKSGLEWMFKLQIALLYLGAGLNKILDPDWISGQYFDFFFTEPYSNQLYISVSKLFPSKLLASLFGVFTILTEFSLGIWVLIGKRRYLLVILIHGFHLAMLILTAGALSYIFYFLMAVSSYLILPWAEKEGVEIRYPENSKVFQFLKITDSDRFFTWIPLSKEKMQFFEIQKFKFKIIFYFRNLIYHKVLFGFCVISLVFVSRYKNHILNLF